MASYYVGYAKFFGVSSDDCDKFTWHLLNPLENENYLTLDRRGRMDDLVDLMTSLFAPLSSELVLAFISSTTINTLAWVESGTARKATMKLMARAPPGKICFSMR